MIKKLTAKHYQAIQMRLDNIKNAEIVKVLGIADITLNRWICDPLFKNEEERQRLLIINKAKQALQNATQIASDTLIKACYDDQYTNTNIKAAELVLKYAGLEPPKQINANIVEKVIIVDDIEGDEDENVN